MNGSDLLKWVEDEGFHESAEGWLGYRVIDATELRVFFTPWSEIEDRRSPETTTFRWRLTPIEDDAP